MCIQHLDEPIFSVIYTKLVFTSCPILKVSSRSKTCMLLTATHIIRLMINARKRRNESASASGIEYISTLFFGRGCGDKLE